MTQRFYTIGKIVNTHGIRGDVKVLLRTDFPEQRFAKGSLVYVEDAQLSKPVPLKVVSAKPHKNVYLVKFDGLDRIEDVEKWKGSDLKISEEQLLTLDEGEYYYHEIIGCKVYDIDSKAMLGTISEILHPGANDVWVCKRDGKKDLLIPYIEDVVVDVDTEQKQVNIRLLEGML